MKIEWLNEELTEAHVTVGWRKKKRALVHLAKDQWGNPTWYHKTGDYVGSEIDQELLSERKERLNWEPVAPLPHAVICDTE